MESQDSITVKLQFEVMPCCGLELKQLLSPGPLQLLQLPPPPLPDCFFQRFIFVPKPEFLCSFFSRICPLSPHRCTNRDPKSIS